MIDDEMALQIGEHHIGDIDLERFTWIGFGIHFDGHPGNFRLPRPRPRDVIRGIDALAVDRQSRIAAQIPSSPGASHHPKAQLTFDELNFGSADTRRPVSAHSGHRVMLASGEECLDA